MSKLKPVRLLMSALLVGLLAAPTAAFAQEAPAPEDVGSMWGGRVVYVEGSTFGPETFTGNEPGTVDDTLYLVAANGLAHPISLTMTTSELQALPDAPNTIGNVAEIATECMANPVLAATTDGEFFIGDSMLRVALGGYKYTVSVNAQPMETIEALPSGDTATRVGDVFPMVTLENCMGMMPTPVVDEPMTPAMPAPTMPEPEMPGMCTPQMVDRSALAAYAGNVIVPDGSSFLNDKFLSPNRPGTVDDDIYLIDGMGLSHVISLSNDISLPEGDAISDVYELLAMCPVGGMMDPATEGKFFVQDNELRVVHMGFAHPVMVMAMSDDDLEAWPNGPAVSTYGEVIHAQ